MEAVGRWGEAAFPDRGLVVGERGAAGRQGGSDVGAITLDRQRAAGHVGIDVDLHDGLARAQRCAAAALQGSAKRTSASTLQGRCQRSAGTASSTGPRRTGLSAVRTSSLTKPASCSGAVSSRAFRVNSRANARVSSSRTGIRAAYDAGV